MNPMARKKKYLYICTVEEAEAEAEFFRLNPGVSELACSPPGYHAFLKAKAAKAAKAAAGSSPKRKASGSSRR